MYWRSEEHTSELQSPCNLVCRLLLEKKKAEGVELQRHLRQADRMSQPRLYHRGCCGRYCPVCHLYRSRSNHVHTRQLQRGRTRTASVTYARTSYADFCIIASQHQCIPLLSRRTRLRNLPYRLIYTIEGVLFTFMNYQQLRSIFFFF